MDGILSPHSRNDAVARQPPPAAASMEVAGLSKAYGQQVALANVTFVAQPGEILGLIGPNGAGKTTLLEALAGILPADAGEVRWHGEVVAPADRRKAIFYVPDGVRPYRDQHVVQVLSFFAGVYRKPANEVADAVASLGLAPVLSKRVNSLSKGYGRRLLLALGLLTPHDVLLMDEPFDGFDLRQTREVAGVLRKQVAEGRTLILAIHQLSDAERVCDRFILLADGHVRGSGTLSELRAQTARPAANLEEIFLALT